VSELARITAHYFAVLMEREGISASIPDMRAELEAAAATDAAEAARVLNVHLAKSVDAKITTIVEAAREETGRGRQARRQS